MPPQPSKPEIVFLLPHGYFCIAGKAAASGLVTAGKLRGGALFVDGTLCALSPPMKVSALLLGATNVYPVGDQHVGTALQRKENIFIFPGGFVEAATSTDSGLRLYAGTYSYWLRRALEHGYDLRVVLCYHGAELYRQSDYAADTREGLARRGMPAVLPALPESTSLVVRQLRFELDLAPGQDAKQEADRLAPGVCADIEPRTRRTRRKSPS